MMRWVMGVALAGVMALVGGARSSPAGAEPAVEAAVWRAAGILPFAQSMQAPPLQLGDLSGKPVDLEQFRGRLVMLYFWATW